MSLIASYRDVESALNPYVAVAFDVTGKDITTERTYQLAALAGNPQESLKVVHIAGTSGKTSTTYYISWLLAQAGCSVGWTVSPHIDSIGERVQLSNGLSEARFCEYFVDFMKIADRLSEKPSYFEILIVFALWVFKQEGVDYVVLETGLGGLHDSTNITDQEDKVCVISDIGFDHMHILGNTLSQIAAQKLGIVKQNNHVFIYQQSAEIMSVVQHAVDEQKGQLHIIKERVFGGMPLYQQRNFGLAKAVYEYIRQRDGVRRLLDDEYTSIRQRTIAGRMEKIQHYGKSYILDGAHNDQKMYSFLQSYQNTHLNENCLVLLAMKQGKDIETIAPLIAELSNHVIVTTISLQQDMMHRSLDPEIVAKTLKKAGVTHVKIIPDLAESIAYSEKASEKNVIVTGSLYLVAAARKLLIK